MAMSKANHFRVQLIERVPQPPYKKVSGLYVSAGSIVDAIQNAQRDDGEPIAPPQHWDFFLHLPGSVEMSEEAWYAYFEPLCEGTDPDSQAREFTIVGDPKEEAFVRRQNPHCVWTLAEDGNSGQCIMSGRHCVNSLQYHVTRVAVPKGVEVAVPLEWTRTRWRIRAAAPVLSNLLAHAHLGQYLQTLDPQVSSDEILAESESQLGPPNEDAQAIAQWLRSQGAPFEILLSSCDAQHRWCGSFRADPKGEEERGDDVFRAWADAILEGTADDWVEQCQQLGLSFPALQARAAEAKGDYLEIFPPWYVTDLLS
jgi:hypothetical protein